VKKAKRLTLAEYAVLAAAESRAAFLTTQQEIANTAMAALERDRSGVGTIIDFGTLSTRARNVLRTAGVRFWEDLGVVDWSKCWHCGMITREEILQKWARQSKTCPRWCRRPTNERRRNRKNRSASGKP